MEVGLKHFLEYLVIMWRLMAHFLYISQSMIYLFVTLQLQEQCIAQRFSV